jgi:hypothetical protein
MGGWIEDLANHSRFASAPLWTGGVEFARTVPCIPAHGCYSVGHGGSANFVINRSITVWTNVTGLNTSHRFELWVYVTVNVAADMYGAKVMIVGGHSEASLDMHGKTYGAWLRSVTIS